MRAVTIGQFHSELHAGVNKIRDRYDEMPATEDWRYVEGELRRARDNIGRMNGGAHGLVLPGAGPWPLNPDREVFRNIAQQLTDSFAWHSTPEGHDFWNAIYDRLRAMARGE